MSWSTCRSFPTWSEQSYNFVCFQTVGSTDYWKFAISQKCWECWNIFFNSSHSCARKPWTELDRTIQMCTSDDGLVMDAFTVRVLSLCTKVLGSICLLSKLLSFFDAGLIIQYLQLEALLKFPKCQDRFLMNSRRPHDFKKNVHYVLLESKSILVHE